MTPNERLIRDELEAKGANPNFKVNYLVEAGAGAGKTYTMIQRITNQLVSGDCPPEKLVAITFTVKSTQEMKKRLDEELAERRKNATDPAEKERLDQLIQTAGQMQISTIHSFCQTLLESMPYHSPLGVNMQLLQNDDALCRSFFRRKYWADPTPFDALQKDWGFRYQELENVFYQCCHNDEAKIIYEPVGFAEYLEAEEAMKKQALELHKNLSPYTQKLGDDKKYMQKELADILTLSEADFAKDPKHLITLAKIKNRSKTAIPMREYDYADGARFKEIVLYTKERMKTIKQAIATKSVNAAMKEDVDFISIHPSLLFWRDMNSTWNAAPMKRLKDAAARIVYSLCMEAILPLAEEYRQWKTENNIATLTDLLLRARDMLRDSKEARDYFHNRYQVLYVDEFQDTDPVQAELLFYLTSDPAAVNTSDWRQCKPVDGSLFLVGDPKQAIYRFRGADIDVYNLVKTAFQNGAGQIRQLTHNFRSSEAVCDWTKELFEPPANMTDEKEAKKYFSPESGPLQNRKQAEFTPMDAENGPIPGSYLFSYEAMQKDVTDPLQVAAFIRTMVDEKVLVPHKKGKQIVLEPAQWSDFMILTGRREKIKYHVDALAALDIPVNVTGDQKLIEVETIRKMVLHLQAMVNDQNDMALIRMLTECYGVSMGDLRLLLQRTGWNRLQEGLWENAALSARKALENEETPQTSLIHICDTMMALAELKKSSKTLPAMSIMERLVEDGHGIWDVSMDLQQRKREYGRVQQYLDLIRSGPQHSFPALVSYALECAEASVQQELPLEKEENQVQIMNLHKAKGLEGNIVILAEDTMGGEPSRHVARNPDAEEYATISSGKTALGWPKDWNGEKLDLNAKKGTPRVSKKDEEKEYLDAEKVRLLYVAVTRAAYWLVVCGMSGGKSGGAWKTIAEHQGFLSCQKMIDNATDPALRKALESLRTGEHHYKKNTRQKASVEVSLMQLDEKRKEAVSACADEAAYSISPSKLDAESRSVKRRQEKAEDDTAMQIQTDGKDAEKAVSKEPHGPDWGTIIHRIMELAVREQKFDQNSIQRFAAQAVSETIGGIVLTKTQKNMLLNGVDMDAKKAMEFIADKAAAAVEFVKDKKAPLHQLMADAACYPELPFMVRISDKNSDLYQHLSSHISDEKATDKLLDVEGVIDLAIYQKEGSWVVVDYKTDKFKKNETVEELKHRLMEEYTPQILSYVKILESMGKGKVTAAYLCSIPMKGELISLPLDGKIPPASKAASKTTAATGQTTVKKDKTAGHAVSALKQGRTYAQELASCEGMNRFSLLLDGEPVKLRNKKGEWVTEVEKCAPFTFAVGDWMKQQYPEQDVFIDDRNAGNQVRIRRLLKTMQQVLPAEMWQRLSITWRKEERGSE